MRYCLIFTALFCGCSFKESNTPTSVASTETVTLSWTGDKEYVIKRTLSKRGDAYSAQTPVTLSIPVPGSISIEGSLPLASTVYVERVTATRDGSTYPLAASFREGRLEIYGLRSVLNDDKDQRLDLLLEARDSTSGASPWSLSLALLTMPTAVSIESLPLSSFKVVRKLTSPNLRLDLLKVIRVKNGKSLALDLQTKGRWLKGHLARPYTIHEVQRHQCSYTASQRGSIEVLATQFALLPIKDDLPASWLTYLHDQRDTLSIAPGEGMLIGLYGSGPALATYVDSGIPSVQPTTVRVVASCEQDDHCGPGPRFDNFRAIRCGTYETHAQALEGTEGHAVSIVFVEESHQGGLTYSPKEPGEIAPMRPQELFPSSLPLF